MVLKNFKVESYGRHEGAFCNADYPSNFEAEINEEEGMNLEKIINEVISRIKGAKGPERSKIFEHDARIPCSNVAIDNENNVAGFVLLQENHWIAVMEGPGMTWYEGGYGIKIDGNKVRGRIIDFGYGSHGPDGDSGDHYRFVVSGVENGMLKYVAKKRVEWESKPHSIYGFNVGSKSIAKKIEDFERKVDLKNI